MRLLTAILFLTASLASGQTVSQANVWVSATAGGSCTRSSSAVAFSQATSCSSFNNAYTAASGGDLVGIAAGSYSQQTISATSKASTVTFARATGATVTVAGVSVNSKFVEIRGGSPQDSLMVLGDLDAEPPGGGVPANLTHFTIRNATFTSIFMYGQNLSLIGNNIGNFDSCLPGHAEDGIDIWDDSVSQASTSVLINGNIIHDVTDEGNQCGTGTHVDCLQMIGGHQITITQNQFYNCPTSDVIARPFRDTLSDLDIENNWMQDVVSPGAALNLGSSGDAISGTNKIFYNTIENASVVFSSGTLSIIGNIIAVGSCGSGGNYDFNVFNPSFSVTCGTHTKKAAPSYVGPTPNPAFRNGIVPNYSLNSGDTVAKQAGSPTIFPATDIFGTTRPQNVTSDAGAFEIVNGTPQAATPTFSPVAGTYASTQTVTITSLTASVTICYTTDGTAPTANGAGTCTHGTTLTNGGTVSVASSVTVQALATLNGDTDSAVGSATYTIGIPVASLAPASLSFGGVNISNTSAPQTLTLQNTGTAVMSITSISLAGANTGDFFQSNNCPVGSNLGNGSSCTITATFTPLAVGSRTASVSVVDGASGSPHTSALSGTGVQPSIASQMNSGVRLSGRVVVK